MYQNEIKHRSRSMSHNLWKIMSNFNKKICKQLTIISDDIIAQPFCQIKHTYNSCKGYV